MQDGAGVALLARLINNTKSVVFSVSIDSGKATMTGSFEIKGAVVTVARNEQVSRLGNKGYRRHDGSLASSHLQWLRCYRQLNFAESDQGRVSSREARPRLPVKDQWFGLLWQVSRCRRFE